MKRRWIVGLLLLAFLSAGTYLVAAPTVHTETIVWNFVNGLQIDGVDVGSGGGGGAPTNATYITKSASSGLSAEQSLGSLTTGLLLNTVSSGTGTLSTYGGSSSCSSGNHVASISASGAVTCTADTGGGSGAPTNATYITQTANGSLSGEQALGSLATGIMNSTTTTGVVSTLAPTDDNILVGNGTAWQLKALPNCTDTGGNHLNYTLSSNTFSCGTSGGSGGAQTPWASDIDGGGFSLSNVTDITVNGTGAGTISLGNATNSNTTGFQGSVVASNIIYTLPTADGTSGQALVTNGSKVLSWASGGGSGTVTSSGTPTSGQTAEFTTATNIVGVTPTGTGAYVKATSPTLVTPALGTPASGVATNLTGTAAGLTAGTVTTNANLTGDVTSSGNATTLATVNSNVGSFTGANITVNAKGLITAAANGSGGGGTLAGARVSHSTDQNTTSGTPLRVAFNTESGNRLYDNGGLHDNATNNSRITVATTGIYNLFTNLQVAANAVGVRDISFVVNGTDYVCDIILPAVASVNTSLGLSCMVALTAGDFVEVELLQNSGSTLAVVFLASYTPIFGVQLITQ